MHTSTMCEQDSENIPQGGERYDRTDSLSGSNRQDAHQLRQIQET